VLSAEQDRQKRVPSKQRPPRHDGNDVKALKTGQEKEHRKKLERTTKPKKTPQQKKKQKKHRQKEKSRKDQKREPDQIKTVLRKGLQDSFKRDPRYKILENTDRDSLQDRQRKKAPLRRIHTQEEVKVGGIHGGFERNHETHLQGLTEAKRKNFYGK